ncbi:HEAT repeat-containing protein [Anoxybacillus pushchinoensis]|uniref:HEAT repeat-containing protein n=1 Tax=Anoxybacillus pushchinoensis TaxID=150248 RepID=A0A1I0T4M7_9BACL|nr:conserved virulence factor C family protein [Anoxybacillus pushchinoensis]QAV26576.1 virulence factor [Neobacillus thermocopriae]SFA46647.1 HEAT repeat-containing protein [Anoxybacillus pushchinoensis]
MKIQSIEPTPSPNTMKVLLDEELPFGTSYNYKPAQAAHAPAIIQQLLQIEGVKGIYHVADFLAIERHAKYDWKPILTKVREVFGEQVEELQDNEPVRNDHFGEVKVYVQMLYGLPMQVKLTDGHEERRVGLPKPFVDAVLEAQKHAGNIVIERKWVEKGVRYGTFEEIGADIVEELSAAYPPERLERLVHMFKQGEQAKTQKRTSIQVTEQMLENPDWTKRYAALEQMIEPKETDLPVLAKALKDEKVAIRRLATAYLGMIGGKSVLPYLYEALKDPAVSVRRTAGDCLSDIGDVEAIPVMVEALNDASKLVRWRAAMFLYENGDESVLPALKAAENDPEFEVSMQVKMAIERIEGGEEAKGSVWKQMTESRKR